MKKLLNLSLLVDEAEIDSVIEKSKKLIKHPGCINFHSDHQYFPIYYRLEDLWSCKSIVINFNKNFHITNPWLNNLKNIFRYWSNISFCGRIRSYIVINENKVVCNIDMSNCSSSNPKDRGIFESLFFCLVNGVVFKRENQLYCGFGAENIDSMTILDKSAVEVVRKSFVESHQIFEI